jgi:hypothetical protein
VFYLQAVSKYGIRNRKRKCSQFFAHSLVFNTHTIRSTIQLFLKGGNSVYVKCIQ